MTEALRAVLGLYDASLAPERWSEALDRLVEATGAKCAMLFGHDLSMEYSAAAASRLFAAQAHLFPVWIGKFGHIDAHGRAMLLSRPPFSTLTDEEIWPGEDLWNRPDLRFLRDAAGTFRRMGVNLSAADGIRAGIIFYYDQSIATIPQSEHELVRAVAPHAAKAIQIHRSHFGLLERYRAVLSVLDRVNVGIAVVTGDGQVVIANESARATLDRDNAIRIRPDNRLEVADEDADREVRHYLSAAHGTARNGSRLIDMLVTVRRPHGREPLLLEVHPLRDGRREIEPDFAGALLYLIDPETPPEIDISPLARTFGLTKTEAAVAGLLIRGHTIGEIAEIRDVSFHTVQSQTRSIYQKTGLSTRGEIVHKAVSLRPPLI